MDLEAYLRDYQSLRRVCVPLSNQLTQTLSQDEIRRAADDLGMLQGEAIVLETEDEIAVLMDYAIYALRRDGKNAIERMLAESPPPEGSLELRLLRSARNAHFTLLKALSVYRGYGVEVLDLTTDSRHLLMDVGFSLTAQQRFTMAARIYSPAEGAWWMSTGAALPLYGDTTSKIAKEIERCIDRYGLDSDSPELCALSQPHLPQPARRGENPPP